MSYIRISESLPPEVDPGTLTGGGGHLCQCVNHKGARYSTTDGARISSDEPRAVPSAYRMRAPDLLLSDVTSQPRPEPLVEVVTSHSWYNCFSETCIE